MPEKSKSKKGKHLSRSGRREHGIPSAAPHAQASVQTVVAQTKEAAPVARPEPAAQSRKQSFLTGPSAIRRSFLGREVGTISILSIAIIALIIVLARVI